MDLRLIREARKRERLTQAELGRIVGVDGSQICRFESGKRAPRFEEAVRIADRLKLKLSDIRSETGPAGTEAIVPERVHNPGTLSGPNTRAMLPLAEGTAIVEFPRDLSERSRKSLKLWLEAMLGLIDP